MSKMTKKELDEELFVIMQNPTVLKDREGTPIEYLSTKRNRRIKERRVSDVSLSLMIFVLSKGGNAESLERFASGDFVGFLGMSKAYNIS